MHSLIWIMLWTKSTKFLTMQCIFFSLIWHNTLQEYLFYWNKVLSLFICIIYIKNKYWKTDTDISQMSKLKCNCMLCIYGNKALNLEHGWKRFISIWHKRELNQTRLCKSVTEKSWVFQTPKLPQISCHHKALFLPLTIDQFTIKINYSELYLKQ